jgi:hypothetical protein
MNTRNEGRRNSSINDIYTFDSINKAFTFLFSENEDLESFQRDFKEDFNFIVDYIF